MEEAKWDLGDSDFCTGVTPFTKVPGCIDQGALGMSDVGGEHGYLGSFGGGDRRPETETVAEFETLLDREDMSTDGSETLLDIEAGSMIGREVTGTG